MPLFLIAGLVVVGCGGNGKGRLAATGQIEGVGVDVGSKIGGRVAEVLVHEGDRVKEGDVLVRLESQEADARVAAAQAQLSQAEAFLAKVKTGARPEELAQAKAATAQVQQQYEMAQRGFRPQEVDAARAAVEAAQARRDQAASDFKRLEPLRKSGAVSDQMYDQAKHAFEAADAQLNAAKQQYDLMRAGTREEQIAMAKAAYDRAAAALEEVQNGARPEDIQAAQAARDAAEAGLHLAESGRREMTVVSPRDGVIESIDVDPGDIVKPGAFIRVTDPNDLELVTYVSAAALGYLRVGEEVLLTSDSYGSETFEGRIVYLASQGEYTPRNLQTQEERVQQMFGVKLKLDSAGGKLKAGVTATVHFDLTRNAGEDAGSGGAADTGRGG